MKRKAILIFAAMLMVVSGVAAVSAYEAHTVNVKAHVENALTVDTTPLDFGTVFPQEVFIEDITIDLSGSALESLGAAGTASGNLSEVDIEIFAEYKVETGGEPPLYYRWLGEWLWVGLGVSNPTGATDLYAQGYMCVGIEPDPSYNPAVGPDPTKMAKTTGEIATLNFGNQNETLKVVLLTPCFKDFYNEFTDTGKPDWFEAVILAENWPLLENATPTGTDLGLDLKIQVTAIRRNS